MKKFQRLETRRAQRSKPRKSAPRPSKPARARRPRSGAGRWELSFPLTVANYARRPAHFDARQIQHSLKAMREAGIRWVHATGINLLEPVTHPPEGIVKAVRGWMRDFGFQMSSHHVAAPVYATLERSQTLIRDNLLRVVDVFRHWKPRALVLHAGWMSVDPEDVARLPDSLYPCPELDRMLALHDEQVERHGEEAVIEVVAANLKAMARAAADHGIRLALENLHGYYPLGDQRTLELLVKAIDEPNVGYCLDAGHAWVHGIAPEDCVRWMGSRLYETHFHDNRGGSATGPSNRAGDEHLPVGFGTINWRAVIQALDEVGFPGPIAVEAQHWPMKSLTEACRQAVTWWRACETFALPKPAR